MTFYKVTEKDVAMQFVPVTLGKKENLQSYSMYSIQYSKISCEYIMNMKNYFNLLIIIKMKKQIAKYSSNK